MKKHYVLSHAVILFCLFFLSNGCSKSPMPKTAVKYENKEFNTDEGAVCIKLPVVLINKLEDEKIIPVMASENKIVYRFFTNVDVATKDLEKFEIVLEEMGPEISGWNRTFGLNWGTFKKIDGKTKFVEIDMYAGVDEINKQMEGGEDICLITMTYTKI